MPVKGIRILAHRCGQRRADENTLGGLRKAREDGADGVECDVRLTADGEPVLFHDDDLRRACGLDRPVRSLKWAELKGLKVFGREGIPHFNDALGFLRDWPGAELVIDLHEDRFDLAEAVGKAVVSSGLAGRCQILGFYSQRAYLLRAKQAGGACTRLSMMPGEPWNIARSVALKSVELCVGWDKPIHRVLYKTACLFYPTVSELARARAAGTAVSGGIANSPEDVRYFLGQGVDGIWTDDVPMARAALEG